MFNFSLSSPPHSSIYPFKDFTQLIVSCLTQDLGRQLLAIYCSDIIGSYGDSSVEYHLMFEGRAEQSFSQYQFSSMADCPFWPFSHIKVDKQAVIY